MSRLTTYTIDGLEFKLRPTSRKVMTALQEYSQEIADNVEKVKAILERKIEGEDISDEDIPTIPDEFEMAFDMFCIITDGPHEKLNVDDFDVHIGQEAIENFMPYKVPTM